MELTYRGLKDRKKWEKAGIALPSYDPREVAERTKKSPVWAHFGIGNIFRIFIGGTADGLLSQGLSRTGINCLEAFDPEIVEKIYESHDCLSISVTLKPDGSTGEKVIGSLSEAVDVTAGRPGRERLREIFVSPSLQLVSFTVTEKAYSLRDASGELSPAAAADMEGGPENARGVIAIVTAMLFERFKANGTGLALVSMDNVSRNGEKLRSAVSLMAAEWRKRGFVGEDFIGWISDPSKVSFPWTMIDKITPRPGMAVSDMLKAKGVENVGPITTAKHTYIAPFVNAEAPGYLVIEDSFPNGRPPFEKCGVFMTDRETVNKAERMKVTVCLNPIHTGVCTYGTLLGYDLFADAIADPELSRLGKALGFGEGLPVVKDPGIISPEAFLNEVLTERFPNRCLGDTNARIAVDISQMLGIRFGETVKEYVERYGGAERLTAIPLAIAGWLRYLVGIDDEGRPFDISPDPMLPELREQLRGLSPGDAANAAEKARPILSNENIFGTDLYKAGIGGKIEKMFAEELASYGAVRKTLRKYLVIGDA